MRWAQSEYLWKGIYLGLLLFAALQEPSLESVGLLALCTLGGLAVALAIAGYGKRRRGYQVKGRWPAFLLFLLLESPELVFAGVLLGTGLGALAIRNPETEQGLLLGTVGGGAVLGLGYWFVRHVRHRGWRLGLSLALAVAPVAVVLAWMEMHPNLLANRPAVGLQLLVGMPIFYLLTLAGKAEESEVESGAICAGLALGMWLLPLPPNLRIVPFVVLLMAYFAYITRFLPRIRVFKHTMRAMSHASVGQHGHALLAFRRALELDPGNKLAREGMWALHRAIDLSQVSRDPELLAQIDVELCLGRANSLLETRPSPAQITEAHNLLDFVLSQRPALKASVQYLRAIAHTHAGEYDRAAQELMSLLDPANWSPDDADREAVLLTGWRLALTLSPELQKRVGAAQLAIPGRRMEAIGAVERSLAATPDFPPAWELKRLLYSQLTEGEYNQAAGPEKAARYFDHPYVQQLGLALLADPTRWQRGAEYLRLAARGLPNQGPSIYVQIAQACEKAGDSDAAWQNYQLAQKVGRAVGPKNLTEDDRQAYFTTVKQLAEHAIARNDLDAAIESYHLYTEYERSGVETLRTMADLYEKKKDVLNAVRVTEEALLYVGGDKDMTERKDRYYYSVTPELLKLNLEAVKPFFDVKYCLAKAKYALDLKTGDLEMVEWGLHLAELAQVVQPQSVSAMLLRARAHLLRGQRDEALVILENLHCDPPKGISGDDQDAWYVAHRILADLYLNELSRPDLAIDCLKEFRKSSRSGADTLYKLGQAYEQAGDSKTAAKYYQQVTAYESHPLVSDARAALYRVQATS